MVMQRSPRRIESMNAIKSAQQYTAIKLADLLWHPLLSRQRVRTCQIQRPGLLVQPHIFACLNVGVAADAMTPVREV
jgi:hypothetical protein